MKKLLFLLLPFILTSCVSLVPKSKLNEWSLQNGYILAKDIPVVVIPKREAQPHPIVPKIMVVDAQGNEVILTEGYLMEIIVTLFGTVEKYQYLVEIYEREYLNAGGKVMPDLTLEELKNLYKSRLSDIETGVVK